MRSKPRAASANRRAAKSARERLKSSSTLDASAGVTMVRGTESEARRGQSGEPNRAAQCGYSRNACQAAAQQYVGKVSRAAMDRLGKPLTRHGGSLPWWGDRAVPWVSSNLPRGQGHGNHAARVREAPFMKDALNTAADRIRQLEEEHRLLDRQLRTLTRRAYLTPDEQREAAELKRRKLSAKDRLHGLREG
jgi:hypothetical protein